MQRRVDLTRPRGRIAGSEYFSWREFFVSDSKPVLADRLKPAQKYIVRIEYGVSRCLHPWRVAHPSKRIRILSGFRDYRLNRAVGGSSDSDHMQACAADVMSPDMTAEELFISIMECRCNEYRQLLLYAKERFIHWSWNVPGREIKREARVIGVL